MGWLFCWAGMKRPCKGLQEGEGTAGRLQGRAESDVLCGDDVRESHSDSEAHVYPEIPKRWLWEGRH